MESCVITIARGFGSGGRTIGRMLAKELDIPFYDNEIIRLASEESGIHERLFGQVDEQLKSSLFKLGREGAYKGELLPPSSKAFVSDDNLFNYQAKIILSLAEKGPCIIVGRCADYVLAGRPDVVRLFVHASLEDCLRNIMELYGLQDKEAKKLILSKDKARSEYYQYYTGHAWDNARNYDLSLNTANLGFGTCVRLVKDYIEIRQGAQKNT